MMSQKEAPRKHPCVPIWCEFPALMSFDGPVGSINRHEIKGPSKDMRF